MARETIKSIKTELELEKKEAKASFILCIEKETKIEMLEKECKDLQSRLAYADKVNLANLSIMWFLRGQVDVYWKMTDTQECDCEECLSDNPINNA